MSWHKEIGWLCLALASAGAAMGAELSILGWWGIPEDKANLIALGILSRQAAMAEAAFRLPPNEDKWSIYDEYMKKLEAEP